MYRISIQKKYPRKLKRTIAIKVIYFLGWLCYTQTATQFLISRLGKSLWQRVFSLFTYALNGMGLCRNNERFTFAGASLNGGALFCAGI